MSSSLWAIQAARKSRKCDVIPGSSHYITAEMKNNLEVSKEGIEAVNQQVLQCALGLNSIIDKINTSCSFRLLVDEIQGLKVLPNISAYDDTSSRSHSTLLRSDYLSDASEAPLKSELNTLLSEKVKLPALSLDESSQEPSEPQVVSHTVPIEKVTRHELHPERDFPMQSTKTEVELETGAGTIENMTFPILKSTSPEHTSESPVKVDKSEPSRDRSEAYQNASEEQIVPNLSSPQRDREENLANSRASTALSPIFLPRAQPNPVTSPNADLSFIPIAKSVRVANNGTLYEFNLEVGSGSHEKSRADEPSEDEHDPDNDHSFQAISSAIRKSFAGKLSSNAYTSASVSDPGPAENKSASPDVSKTAVKLEPTSDETEDFLPKKSRSFYQPSKRSSLFVALPPREPINFRKLSRHSVKVKQEDLSSSASHSIKREHHENGNMSSISVPAPSKNENVNSTSTRIESRDSVFISNRIESQLSRSALKKSELPSLFSEKSYFNKNKPDESSLKMNGQFSASIGSGVEMTNAKPTKTKRMTTETGSPMGLEFLLRQVLPKTASERKPPVKSRSPSRAKSPVRSRSPVKAASSIGIRSPKRLSNSSSVASSRSPTKYSHLNDRSSTKHSQINYTNSESEKEPSAKLIQRLTVATSSSAAKASKPSASKEMILKNRFLTTTLNPENPPLFNPAPRGASPKQETRNKTSEDLSSIYRKKLPSAYSLTQSETQITKSNHIASLKSDLKHKAGQELGYPAKSPIKKVKAAPARVSRHLERGKRSIPNLLDTNVAPRKRALGNAVPLPDAARGKFKKENPKSDSKGTKDAHTPLRSTGRLGYDHNKSSISPGYGPNMLPEIPSDDEVLKNTKYLKSWAETPAILRHMRERLNVDPVNVFGQVPLLRMNEVFGNVSSENETREGKD